MIFYLGNIRTTKESVISYKCAWPEKSWQVKNPDVKIYRPPPRTPGTPFPQAVCVSADQSIAVLLTGGPPKRPVKSSVIPKHGICPGLVSGAHREVINRHELFHSSAGSGRYYLPDERPVILREAEFLIKIIYTQGDHKWDNWSTYEAYRSFGMRIEAASGFLAGVWIFKDSTVPSDGQGKLAFWRFSLDLLFFNPSQLNPHFLWDVMVPQFSKDGLQTPTSSQDHSPWGQNHFHNKTKTLFSFSAVLTFPSMVQKQWWLKLLLLGMSQCRTVNYTSITFIPYSRTLTVQKKKKRKRKKEKYQFYLMPLMKP